MCVPKIKDLPIVNDSFNDSFKEVENFIENFSQAEYFRKKWGKDYFNKAHPLVDNLTKLFVNKEKCFATIREMILVIEIDFYKGSSLGLPENIKTVFYKWMINEIKNNLKNNEKISSNF